MINFDIPNSPDDYVHRIGRTARADATGDAFTLVSQDEEPRVKEIEQELKRSLPRVTLPNFNYNKGGGAKRHDHHPRGGSRHPSHSRRAHHGPQRRHRR